MLLGLALLGAISLRPNFGDWLFFYAEAPKQIVAFGGLTLALLMALFFRPATRLPAIWILLLPFVATLPGAFAHQWHWNYNAYAEWINTGIAFCWALIWTQLWGDRRNGAHWAVFLLIAGAVVTVSGAIIEWAVVNKFAGPPSTLFGNQNYATNYLILVFPFILVMQSQVRRGRWFWLALAFVVIFALVFVLKTRAALMGWAIASYLVLGLWMKTRSFGWRVWFAWWSLPVLSGIALALLIQFYWELASEFRYLQLAGPHAWYPRVLPWMVGWQSVLDAPWIGHGPGSSWSLFHGFIDKVPETVAAATMADYQHIHSDPLEWLQEGGALGLLTYLAVWGWIGWRAIRIALDSNRDHSVRLLAGAAVYGLLAYHLHSLVEVSARMPANRMALFAVGAIVLMLSVKQRPSPSTSAVSPFARWGYLAPILLLLMTGAALWKEIPRQRDTYMMKTSAGIVERDSYWRGRIDYESDSIEAIEQRLVYKLFDQKTPDGVSSLFERMDHRIPKFRNENFSRFFLYLLEHKSGGMEPAKLGDLLQKARSGSERYLPAIEHFTAQYAAHSRQPELLLEVLEDRLFRGGIAHRVVLATRRQDVLVRVDTEGDGFAMSYDLRGRTIFIMGLPQLRLLMDVASERMGEDDALKRIISVPLRIRAQNEPVPGFKMALEALTIDFVRSFAVLAAPPKLE